MSYAFLRARLLSVNLSQQNPSIPLFLINGVFHNDLTANKNIIQSLGAVVAIDKLGAVDDPIGIENADVGVKALAKQALARQLIDGGGHRGHFADHLGEGRHVALADITPQHAGIGDLRHGRLCPGQGCGEQDRG